MSHGHMDTLLDINSDQLLLVEINCDEYYKLTVIIAIWNLLQL